MGSFALIVGIIAASFGTGNAYAQSDTWYVGEGLQQDTYLEYRIQEFDTHDGDPYEMTFYFQEQDADGAWIAPTFVEYRGQVYEGKIRFGNNMAVLGGSEIPEEMRPFTGGYSRSMQWLELFSPKSEPLSLHASFCDKIQSAYHQRRNVKPDDNLKKSTEVPLSDSTCEVAK